MKRKMPGGRIWLEHDVIRYAWGTQWDWRLPITNIRLIGESTNEDGPFADDYFLCFVTNARQWYEASFYAEGRDAFLWDLEARLEADLLLDLQGSVTFNSRILWPGHLEGQPLFDYTEEVPRNLWRHFTRWLGLQRVDQTLSEVAILELERPCDQTRAFD